MESMRLMDINRLINGIIIIINNDIIIILYYIYSNLYIWMLNPFISYGNTLKLMGISYRTFFFPEIKIKGGGQLGTSINQVISKPGLTTGGFRVRVLADN